MKHLYFLDIGDWPEFFRWMPFVPDDLKLARRQYEMERLSTMVRISNLFEELTRTQLAALESLIRTELGFDIPEPEIVVCIEGEE